MNAPHPLTDTQIESCDAMARIDRRAWDSLANPNAAAHDPFLSWDWLEALEASGCVTPETGWAARHLLLRDGTGGLIGAMPLYLKGHSYGEYVFDHAWADALHRAGGRYYPKLLAAIPFTPVTGRRLLAPTQAKRAALVEGALRLAAVRNASSLHINFLAQGEAQEAGAGGLLLRAGVQFHWKNQGYASFDDFLASLSSQKRKSIRRERARAREGLTISQIAGTDLEPAHWDAFFACYQDTGARKWGSPYLNRAFFGLIGERLRDRIVMFMAKRDGRIIAAALNFLGGDTLLGRYWGRLEDHPFLHFELCYYQAIDLAIARGLGRVEAGAQGEHKLARGYAPVSTWSAHWIAHPGLRQAVAAYLKAETPAIAEEIELLAQHTPFRRNEAPPAAGDAQ